MRVTSEVISDNQGESIGSVSNYVSRFKKIDAGEDVKNVPEFTSMRDKITTLPSEWNAQTEKTILTHYYRRLGDRTCTDFGEVADKVTGNINRLFKQTLLTQEVLKKLKTTITIEDVNAYDETVKIPSPQVTVKKIKIALKETLYEFLNNRPPLTPEYLDLVPFVDPANLCFSLNDSGFHLSTKPDCEKCFDKLFDFTPREEMVFQMFKEQLGDEIKAKKLVLMSKMLNQEDEVKVRDFKKTKQKKAEEESELF